MFVTFIKVKRDVETTYVTFKNTSIVLISVLNIL